MTQGHAQTLMSIGVPQNKIYILGGGIPDPYGSDLVTYRRCRKAIEDAIDEFCRFLIQQKPEVLKKDTDDGEDENN